MRRCLLLLALLAGAPAAWAASGEGLHEEPVGTKLSGHFRLGPKSIPLPEGEWIMVAKFRSSGTLMGTAEGAPFGGVFLVSLRGERVAGAMHATGNLEPSRGNTWKEDPCKPRQDVLRHVELGRNPYDQFCLQITPLPGFLRTSSGWIRDAHRWLLDNRIEIPPTMLAVSFTRIDAYWQDRVFYYFDPELQGSASSKSYVAAVTQWADAAAPRVLAGLSGREARPTLPAVLQR